MADVIGYFGVPATAAGSADMFVVHCKSREACSSTSKVGADGAVSYFQPDVVAYPTLNGGATFPDTAGQAISIPNSQNNVSGVSVFGRQRVQ